MVKLDKNKIELNQIRKGLGSMELVAKCKFSYQTLVNIKKGKPCKPQTVHALCKALECDPTDLMDWKG